MAAWEVTNLLLGRSFILAPRYSPQDLVLPSVQALPVLSACPQQKTSGQPLKACWEPRMRACWAWAVPHGLAGALTGALLAGAVGPTINRASGTLSQKATDCLGAAF